MSPDFEVEYLDPKTLKPHGLNFRRHPADQKTALAASMGENGWLSAPIVNRRTGMSILDGHARVELAVEQEEALIPVRVIDVPVAQEKRILRAFDRIGSMALEDPEALDRLIEEIGDVDLERLLSEITEPASGLLPEADPDAVPEVVETRAKAGDLWTLGEHRLLCGDCTVATDVERLLDYKPVLMATDPPYGVNLDQGWRDRAGINRLGEAQGDALDGDDRSDWSEAYALSGATVAYVWHADACHHIVSEGLERAGFEVKQQIIWVKPVHALSRACYHWKHEPCWFAVRKGATIPWYVGRDQMTTWEAASPKMIYGHSSEEKCDHPTQKPIALFEKPILNHTRPTEVVYDPFAGSGTTLIACEQTGRTARCIEIEPRYCDVILARWEQATGKQASRH